jgi:hypothetical protein
VKIKPFTKLNQPEKHWNRPIEYSFTPPAGSHGFNPDLLWSGLRSGCRSTKSRRSLSKLAKLSGAAGLPVGLHRPLFVSADTKHSKEERRYHVLGQTNEGRLLFISFTIRNRFIQVIKLLRNFIERLPAMRDARRGGRAASPLRKKEISIQSSYIITRYESKGKENL